MRNRRQQQDRVWAIEEWRPAPGYEGRYEVSSFGRIRSIPRVETTRRGHRRTVRGGILRPALNAQGYLHVSLRIAGKLRVICLHRLIALAFHGDKRNVLHNEVAHLDNNRANASADNLKWVSKAENMSHRLAFGTDDRGERHASAKLTNEQAGIIKADRWTSSRVLALQYAVSRNTIHGIRQGRRYAHVPARPSTIAREAT